ncbi:MAG TPA: Hpt domain-containing protein [Terriglobales bacterium]|jgi:HPt (histidine-containing phosphotransfer) domain-containing protein|nr:Hpt domain-containing protein [Terriglobales bacterium]
MKPLRFDAAANQPPFGSGAESASAPISSGTNLWGKAEALRRLGGDEDLLRELCRIFLEESPKLQAKLREAIAHADPQAVMRAAHSLKGELGYLGADGPLQAARELEDMGHGNDLSRAQETFTFLEKELAGLHLVMQDFAGERA